jgi:hypothetical protein
MITDPAANQRQQRGNCHGLSWAPGPLRMPPLRTARY